MKHVHKQTVLPRHLFSHFTWLIDTVCGFNVGNLLGSSHLKTIKKMKIEEEETLITRRPVFDFRFDRAIKRAECPSIGCVRKSCKWCYVSSRRFWQRTLISLLLTLVSIRNAWFLNFVGWDNRKEGTKIELEFRIRGWLHTWLDFSFGIVFTSQMKRETTHRFYVGAVRFAMTSP